MSGIAAYDPTDRVDQLTAVTERLTEILRSEIALLKERRPSEVTEFEEERGRLASAYARETQAIRQNRALIDSADESHKKRLKAALEEFRSVHTEHERILQTMLSVSERLVKSIADEVSAKRQPAAGYNANAALSAKTAKKAPALTLNQVI